MKTVAKAFRVNVETWGNFERAARFYGTTPIDLLRELVRHVDSAVKGIESREIQKFDGDVAKLIHREFPQISPFQLRMMARILVEAASQADKRER